MKEPLDRQTRLLFVAWLVLVAGLAAGVWLYRRPAPAPDDVLISVENQRQYVDTIERTVGVFGLVEIKCEDAVTALLQPHREAVIVVALAVAIAGILYRRSTRPPLTESEPQKVEGATK